MIEATVKINVDGEDCVYNIKVPAKEATDETKRRVLRILGASVEMGCALLDAEFKREKVIG